MTIKYGSLPFQEQVDFFRSKVNIPTERWNDLKRDAHDTGFMVAGATKADLLNDLHGAVQKAIDKGTTLDEFRSDFKDIVAKHGWTGWKGSDTEAGIAWRTKLIYETNLRSSYQAGRWQQQQAGKAYRPYLQYHHSHASVNARAEHLAWNGKVIPIDDPWWKAHYPPNGYGCKCTAYALSERDLVRMGKTGPDQAPNDGSYDWVDPKTGEVHTFPVGVQPFWDYTPGASLASQVQAQIVRKVQALPPVIGRQLSDYAKHIDTTEIKDALFLPKSGTARQYAETVLSAIGQVHTIEGLPKIPLKTASSSRYQGKYTRNTTTNGAISITLSTNSVNPELTLAHEIGQSY